MTITIAWSPKGYRELIKRKPDLSMGDVKPESVVMDKRRWAVLHAVNDRVNSIARYEMDAPGEDVWGLWRVVNGVRVGDCDDYAAHKLQRLLKKGFPRGSLLLSICKMGMSNQSYHCVLLVQEYGKPAICLDNRSSGIWRVGSSGTFGYDWKIQEWPGHEFWWRKMT